MSFVDDSLLPDEQVLYRGKLHWKIFVAPILIAVVGVILIVVSIGKSEASAIRILGACLLLPAMIVALQRSLARRSSEFAVTNKRVLIKVGFVKRHSLELLLGKVEGIGVDQDISGRILGYGTIVVTGTGGTKESFTGIDDPLEFRKQVQARIGRP